MTADKDEARERARLAHFGPSKIFPNTIAGDGPAHRAFDAGWDARAEAAEKRSRELEAAIDEAGQHRTCAKANEVATAAQVKAETDLAAARSAIERVRGLVTNLGDDLRKARDTRGPARGMQVPYHGPFCSAPPSVLRDLDHLVRDLTAELKETP